MGLFLLFVSSVLAMMSVSPCVTEARDYGKLRKAIEDSFDCRENPGMAVSIVKDGKTEFSEAFGVLTNGSDVNVTTDTKFMIASLTKAFTAALLVDVLNDNPRNISYSLRTPLRNILGQNFSFADEERTKYASAEDLLSHRIALPYKAFIRFNEHLKRRDFIRLARFWKSKFPLRDRARYSPIGYILAAAITEYLGGKPWEDLLTERILKPLGMESTGFAFTTDFHKRDVTPPYAIYGNTKGPMSPLFTRIWNSRCGSGCVVSTAKDMAKWMNFILSGGKNATGHQVLPVHEVVTLTKIRTYLRSSSRDLITKPAFPVTSVADEYALGWRNGFYNGYKILSHTGSSPGFASMIMMHPEEKVGIFVTMNGDDYKFYYRLPLIHHISDFMSGHQPWLNSTTLCTFPQPWKVPKTVPASVYDKGLKPALPHSEYVGAYKNDLYGEVTVNFNKSTSYLQGFYGVGSWQLFPQKKKDNFYGKGIGATDIWSIGGFQFLAKDDDHKNITRLVIHGFDHADPPVFEREFNSK